MIIIIFVRGLSICSAVSLYNYYDWQENDEESDSSDDIDPMRGESAQITEK